MSEASIPETYDDNHTELKAWLNNKLFAPEPEFDTLGKEVAKACVE